MRVILGVLSLVPAIAWQATCLAQAVDESPVLRRWSEEVPNVLDDIQQEPSFKTRFRFGYSQFPSLENKSGLSVGVEDVFIGKTGLTASGDFQGSFDGKFSNYGGSLQYYLRPLGNYINFGPVLGFRHLQTDTYQHQGVNVGGRLMVVLSRGGAADFSITQTWLNPGTGEDVGLLTFSAGYAVTKNLRLSADIGKFNAPEEKDSRVGLALEWMP